MNKPCPNHPQIVLPEKLTCPLCAQEARQKAYQIQRAIQREADKAAARLPVHRERGPSQETEA